MSIKQIIIVVGILFLIKLFFDFVNSKKKDTAKSKKIMSESERQIASFLDKKNINYKLQYSFMFCRDKKCLPFDFAIFNDKGKLQFLIEYDGQQHFEVVDFGEGMKKSKENFKKCKKHDKIKDRYCRRHKIDLLRIPYYEKKNMYKVITRKLYEYDLIEKSTK